MRSISPSGPKSWARNHKNLTNALRGFSLLASRFGNRTQNVTEIIDYTDTTDFLDIWKTRDQNVLYLWHRTHTHTDTHQTHKHTSILETLPHNRPFGQLVRSWSNFTASIGYRPGGKVRFPSGTWSRGQSPCGSRPPVPDTDCWLRAFGAGRLHCKYWIPVYGQGQISNRNMVPGPLCGSRPPVSDKFTDCRFYFSYFACGKNFWAFWIFLHIVHPKLWVSYIIQIAKYHQVTIGQHFFLTFSVF